MEEPADDVGNGLPDPAHYKLMRGALERPYLPGRSLREGVGQWELRFFKPFEPDRGFWILAVSA